MGIQVRLASEEAKGKRRKQMMHAGKGRSKSNRSSNIQKVYLSVVQLARPEREGMRKTDSLSNRQKASTLQRQQGPHQGSRWNRHRQPWCQHRGNTGKSFPIERSDQ